MSGARDLTRVAIVDDRSLVSSGLTVLLEKFRGITVVDEHDLAPGDVVLVGMAGSMSPPRLGVRIIELSAEWTVHEVARAVTSTRASEGRVRRRGQPLSKHEQVILNMTSNGSSAAQIAAQLDISVRTVERHRRVVVDKLAARSSSHAVAVGPVASAVVDHRSE